VNEKMTRWEKLLSGKFSSGVIATICALLWGSAFPTLKYAYIEFGIQNDVSGRILLAALRFFAASILLFAFSYLSNTKNKKNDSARLNLKTVLYLVVLGLFQTALQYYFFYNGLANTTGIKASVLASSATFFMVLVAHFVYKDDKMNRGKVIGLLSGFIGIILVNWGKDFSWNFSLSGEGFLIFTGIVNTVGTVLAKKLSTNINPVKISAFQMLFGSLMLFGISFVSGTPSLTWTAFGTTLLIYSAFLSAIAFGLWYSLLKYHKAGEITIFKFIVPISGSVFSVLFISTEQFSTSIIFALLLVSIGIFSVNKTRNVNI
jgi:drug/metabolite transporter (DMT)-like permease